MQERLPLSQEEKATASKDWLSLPIQLTSFVGREQEIAAVCALLRRPAIRLLTLIGPGGVGKTRLSLQVITSLANELDDQICFISLMETSDPKLVVPTIAKVLGLQELGSHPILEALKAFLKEKRLLLVLDNLEQVIDAAPALANLLEECSSLKILATSRAILRVSGEYTFYVPPLALPDLTQLPAKEELLQYSAITLFLERTRTILPEFILNEGNSRIIAEICTHLDGLPLAIELAVPRLKLLSLQTLLERLDHRFQVLTHGMRDAPGRHQTLQNTLEWSYRLLNPEEQQLFRFLSVFVGGCTLQGIEIAWELTGYQQEKELLLEDVASLLDKSMLYRSTQEAEEPRLFMLRTIREYGLQRLTLTGELEQIQWAHALYYLRLAEEAEPQLKGPHPRPWLDRMQREHDNLREAFCFLIARAARETNKETEMALRLGKALERFWIIGGHVKEGRDLLEQTLKRRNPRVPSLLRGQALCVIATLARYQGDFSYAVAVGEESLAIFRELGDPAGITGSLYRLGYIAWMRGDPITARTYFEECLPISGKEAWREECKDARSETLYYFASMAFFQGDAQIAHPLVEESLNLSRELDDQYNIAAALGLLGWISLLQEDVTGALALQEESLIACRELGNQRGIAHTLSALGEIAYVMGNFAQACEHYEKSLTLLTQLDDRLMITIYLECLARVAVALDEVIWATHLLSTASAVRQIMGTSATPLESVSGEQILSTLHDLLDEHVFATAWVEGQVMSPEQAIATRSLPTQVTSPSPLEKEAATSTLFPRPLHNDLTQRERDVLRLIALGLTDAQVAERLVISRRTVNSHVASIYRKLEVSSRSAATRYALESHLF